MMAKLNSADALPLEAQTILAGYRAMIEHAPAAQAESAETTIQLVYRSYYVRFGGTGIAPDSRNLQRSGPMPVQPDDNVTPFRKIKPDTPPPQKRRLPVAVIFIAMIIAVVAYRYLSRGML